MSSSSFLPNIIAPYKSMSDRALGLLFNFIFSCMDGNLNFVTLQSDTDAFGLAITAYAAQVSLAGTRDMNAVEAKREMRKAIIAQVIALGVSVQGVAGTNLAMLTSSGFPLRKVNQQVTLKPAGKLVLSLGANAGEVATKTDSIYGAKVYKTKYAADPITDTTVWQQDSNNTANSVVTGLTKGASYWMQVTITGARKQVVTTNMVLSPTVQ
jgi:hypothetical protein